MKKGVENGHELKDQTGPQGEFVFEPTPSMKNNLHCRDFHLPRDFNLKISFESVLKAMIVEILRDRQNTVSEFD